MSSSAVVESPSPLNPSISDIDDGDEEIEYEEIEVEEEIEEEFEEEEVEEEEEEEDDESEFGEALTPVRQENQTIEGNHIVEVEEHDEQIKSGSLTPEISISHPLPDIPIIPEVVGERTSRGDDTKVSFDDHTEVNDVERNFVVDVNVALTTREKDTAVVSDVAEIDQNAVEVVEIIEQTTPRLHVPQIRLRESSSSTEFDGENKRQRTACEFHAKGWCIKGSSCSFLHMDGGLDATVKRSEVKREASPSAYVPPQESGVNSKLNVKTEKLILHNDDLLGTALLPACEENLGQNSYLDNGSYYAVPLVKGSSIGMNGTYHGNLSGCSIASHENHHNSRSSTFGIKLEEKINKKSDIVQNDRRSFDLSHYHPRQPLSFGLSSWNINSLGTQSLLEKSSLEHRTSVSFPLQRSTSPFSCSASQNISRNRIFRDIDAIYKTKMCSGDWEPSVPFCPSHVITRNLLSKENLYDPIRDSIEQTYLLDGPIKFSYSGHGSSVVNVNLLSNSSQEEKLLNPVHVEDTGKDNISSSGYGNRLNFDKPKHKMEQKADGSGKNDETVTDSNRDGHVQSESKAVKYFQASLIEFVKELVKPTWREGLLSKDAHKIIVKKATDKVLSTLQPHQVPSTPESVKLYLSSSQPKLAKLVEGYIDKYGKF